ncbi:uncharacterized protein LOC126988842 [Eriocheir sinensis]|uniref:uncharacterized protein LOC126988842 n=1 Tax=Eriocheir sinensis TaxID=95602 RepID=UPI0021C77DF6|nr:uncharacterized protein LOC126988842 [Eriocheir sinensis]
MEEVFAVMNLQQQQQQQPHAAAATLHADDVDDQIMGQAALEVEAMDNTSQAEAVDNTSHPRNGADVGGGEVGDVPETPKSTGEHITGESLGNNNRGALGGVGKMGRRVLREGLLRLLKDVIPPLPVSRLKNDPPASVTHIHGNNNRHASVMVCLDSPSGAESRERRRSRLQQKDHEMRQSRLEKKMQHMAEVLRQLQQQETHQRRQDRDRGQERRRRMTKNNLPKQQEHRDPRLSQKSLHKVGRKKLQVAKRQAGLFSSAAAYGRGKPMKKNLSVTKKLVFEDPPARRAAAAAAGENLAPQPGPSNAARADETNESFSSTDLPSAFNSLNFSHSMDVNNIINVLDESPIFSA